MENKKSTSSRNIIALILLAVVLGFLAGISGEFFARYYLSNFNFFSDLYFTDRGEIGSRDIIIQEPKKVVIEQELRVNQIKNDMQLSMAGMYKKKAEATDLINNIFVPADYLGQAMILTSDGWLLTASYLITQPADDLLINYNQQTYAVEQLVEDEASGVVFLKIAAENLPVIKLTEFGNVADGQQVMVYNSYLDQIDLAYIKDKRYQKITSKYDFVNSSQSLDKNILLNTSLEADFKGSPIVNFQGEIIAILVSQGNEFNLGLPIHYLKSVINQVLKGEEIKRPFLGINYLNIGQVAGLNQDQTQAQKQGALIISDQNSLSFLPGSPLAEQLVPGDIITAIEGQKIDLNNDLLDILLQYKSGQSINLKYIHDNEEKEITVVL